MVRVDLLGKVANANSAASPGSDYGSKAVFGTSTVQSIESKEGSVLSVQHYNSDICSVLSYATERGGVHGWDLRASKEAFNLPMRPELGMSTCLSLSPDRNWICVGTSEGYLALWDIRFNSLAKLWRHSSCATIHRIACARGSRGGSAVPLPKGNTLYGTNGAYLFVAAGNNEAAVWGIPEGGECIRCFRSIPLDDSRKPLASLPTLDEVSLNSRHPSAPIFHAIKNISSKLPIRSDSIRSLLGRVSSSKSSSSYLITSGTDASIRYWDFADAENCYTVTGPGLAQPKGIFDIPRLGRVDKNYSHVDNRLMVCYVTSPPSQSKIVQSQLPQRESRGIVPASTSFKVTSSSRCFLQSWDSDTSTFYRFQDAVLDMKVLDLPGKMLVAGSRDGEIKLWR